ncbi:hypothetical protein [Streptomyces himastatinicus]|uniref:hypothetical protein n=1 Tax=Streptomyces himastatinicus TaxID=998084 RepID=UPI0001B5185C|nr:hypothetical protein [Streptomyces himastatinicus]
MPEVKEADDLPPLPIDRYKLGKRATKEFDTARNRLAQRCMVGLGFTDFPLDPKPPKSYGSSGAPGAPGASLLTLRRSETPLGPLDLDQAKRWGYGWAPAKAPLGVAGPKGRAMTDKEYAALYGRSGDAPKGGCAGQGDRQLLKGVADATHMWAYPSRRQERLEKAVAKDRRMRKAFATWSDCVVDKGFKRYRNPEAARQDKAWGTGRDGNTTHTQREVGTAVADIECKRKHNTLGVWWSVTAERQRADIDRNKAVYEAVRRDLDTVRANVRSTADG